MRVCLVWLALVFLCLLTADALSRFERWLEKREAISRRPGRPTPSTVIVAQAGSPGQAIKVHAKTPKTGHPCPRH